MSARVELHREDRVARLERGEVHPHVRLRARMRLDVRVLGGEERLGAVDRDRLDLVDDLAAAVVALARVSLGVLVRRHRPDRFEHARPGEVLRGDQLDLTALTLELRGEQLRDLRIDLCEAGGAEVLEGFLRDGHAALLPGKSPGMLLAPQASTARARSTSPAPSRSTTGRSPVKSITVEGTPGSSPASTTSATPFRISCGTSATVFGSRPPWRFALVAATAPTRSSTCLP